MMALKKFYTLIQYIPRQAPVCFIPNGLTYGNGKGIYMKKETIISLKFIKN
jgi:hypothetical protein